MVVIVVSTWVSTMLDDLHDGRPCTFQTDAYVDHNEVLGIPSHFIALNLYGRLKVIELAACRRERSKGHASRSDNIGVLDDRGRSD